MKKRAKWVMTLVLEVNADVPYATVEQDMRKIMRGDMASKDFYDSPVGSGFQLIGISKVAEV